MTAVIIDYGSGNLRSVAKALEYVSQGGCPIMVSSKPADIQSASHVVLPGVGAFGDCKAGLESVPGLKDALTEAVLAKAKPFLGICVGMQLLADAGFEHGEHPGLGWVAGSVKRLEPTDPHLKIPHMGWNELVITHRHSVLEGIGTGAHAYFVHSYHFCPRDENAMLASTDYAGNIAAVIGKENIIATQFHPEKSQETGLRLLHNFLRWKP